MIHVLIVDDHAIVREGLANVLATDPDVHVAGMLASGAEVPAFIRKHKVDVVLLDLSMPGVSGMETLKQIKIEWEELPVLMLSMHPEQHYAVRCLRAGAAGYLTKACEKRELHEAVHRAATGRQYITATVGECLLQEVQRPHSGGELHHVLSDRELEVFQHIAEGVSLAEVARRMNLSPKTISTYRARILEKMGLAGNSDILHYAIEHHLTGR